MQEYCISDRAKRRRLEEKNEAKKGPAVMIVTITKSGTRKTEETTVAEERKPLFVIFMARTKAIRQMSAPSPLRGKKSSIDSIPNRRSQSITPRSCHHSLRQRQPLGLLRQIGRCHTQFSITTRYCMHHLHNNQYQCYHLRSIVRHGPEAPHHCLATQQIYLHLRNLSRGRF